MKRLYTGVLAFAAILSFSAALAGGSQDVRDIMSANQFHSTGLDKLSPEQIAAFNAALPSLTSDAGSNKPFDLRDAMTVNQFHKVGLDTLTAEQMAALNGWVNTSRQAKAAASTAPQAPQSPPAAAPAPTTAATFGADMLAPAATEPDRVETRIPGSFAGWTGKTIFKLENGQVWQQAEPGVFNTKMQDPAVVIKKLGWGYLLTIPGESNTVFVRRIH